MTTPAVVNTAYAYVNWNAGTTSRSLDCDVDAGWRRKFILAFTWESADTGGETASCNGVDAVEFAYITYTGNVQRIRMFYLDIPDAWPAGTYTINYTLAASTSLSLFVWQCDNLLLGGPEDYTTAEGTGSATLSGSAMSVSANSLQIAAGLSAATSLTVSSFASPLVERYDNGGADGSSWSYSVADGVQSTSGSFTPSATFSASWSNYVLAAASFTSAGEMPNWYRTQSVVDGVGTAEDNPAVVSIIAPQSGDLIVTAIAINKYPDAYTLPTGFTLIEDKVNSGGSVSQVLAYKISDGTETSVTWAFDYTYNAYDECCAWVGVYRLKAGEWELRGSGENDGGESSVTSLAVGPVSAEADSGPIAEGLAIAIFASDSYTNVGDGSLTNGFVELWDNRWGAAGGGEPGLTVGEKTIPTGDSSVSTTWSCVGGGDQVCGSLAIFTRKAGAFAFDGATTDYLSVTGGSSTNPAAIPHTWFAEFTTPAYADMTTGDIGQIIGVLDEAANFDNLGFSTGMGLRLVKTGTSEFEIQAYAVTANDSQLEEVGIVVSENTRYRIAAVVGQGTNLKGFTLHVDTFANSVSAPDDTMANQNMYAMDAIYIGVNRYSGPGWSWPLVGKVHRAAWWSAGLSQSDITSLLDTGNQPDSVPTNLTAFWDLTRGSIDDVGGTYTLTNYGTLTFVTDSSTTSVSSDSDTRWNILNYIQNPLDLRWNLFGHVSDTITFDWDLDLPVVERTSSVWTTNVTDHAVQLPSSINAGELLIIGFAAHDDFLYSAHPTPSGWTQLGSQNLNGYIQHTVYAKVADGTEGGTSVTITTAEAQSGSAHAFRITRFNGNIATDIDAFVRTTYNSSIGYLAATATAGWGVGRNLYLNLHGSSDDDGAITAWPADGYHSPLETRCAAGTNNSCNISSQWKFKIGTGSDTDSPTTYYTYDQGEAHVDWTIIINTTPYITRRWPLTILANTNLSGVVSYIQDDPESPDSDWLTIIN